MVLWAINTSRRHDEKGRKLYFSTIYQIGKLTMTECLDHNLFKAFRADSFVPFYCAGRLLGRRSYALHYQQFLNVRLKPTTITKRLT